MLEVFYFMMYDVLVTWKEKVMVMITSNKDFEPHNTEHAQCKYVIIFTFSKPVFF